MDDRELTDSGEEADADRSGVSRSSESTAMSLVAADGSVVSSALSVLDVDVARELLFARFAALCELSDTCEDADDSSKVRFGER